MKASPWTTQVAHYRDALSTYAASGEEEHLQAAYELGRSALNAGFGVLDMVRLHQEALVSLVASTTAPIATVRLAKAVETFLLEALSPFEAAHRGFRDACERLHQLNATLNERNAQLAAANKQLEQEIVGRKAAQEAAEQSEESLRQLSNKVLTAQEEERKHISRELHDEIGQTLTAANVSIALLRKHGHADAEFARKVESAQRLLEQSMDMIHRFARELRPSMLDHLGPFAAMQNYVKSYTARTGIAVKLENTADVARLDVQQGTVLYRIAQECLTNVFKHAHATRVKIRLSQQQETVCLEIADNGRGAATPLLAPGPHHRQRLGLIGMQERVRLVNGQFAIESAPRRGTTVRVQIPLSPQLPTGRGTPSLPTTEPTGSTYDTSHEQNQCASCR